MPDGSPTQSGRLGVDRAFDSPGERAVGLELAGRAALLEDASRRALSYLESLRERSVAPSAAAVAALDRLDTDLPLTGRRPSEVLALLDDVGSPATVASAGPRFFGFVNGGALPIAQAAAWMSAAWDQNAALAAMSPTAARLDEVAMRWIVELLGLPRGPLAVS